MTTAVYEVSILMSFAIFAQMSPVQIEELETKKKELAAQLADLRGKYESIERQDSERRSAVEAKRHEEKEFLNFQRQHLESFLKSSASNN